MIFKKFVSIAKKRKSIFLYTDDYGIQWIGEGIAIYKMNDMPRVAENSILNLMDIPKGKQEDYTVQDRDIPESLSIEENVINDRALWPANVNIIDIYGKETAAFYTGEGIVYLDKKYLNPIDGIELDYIERNTNGRAYIAIKADGKLAALIMQYDLINKTFVESLEKMLNRCKKELSLKIDKENMEE